MHILISPNAFKHSLNAEEVALSIGEGLIKSRLKFSYENFPIGDGGDGTAELIMKKCGGEQFVVGVHDPLGRFIKTQIRYIDDGKTALIEMADASGIRLLQPHELDPLQTSSFGTGEQLIIALDNGATKIIIGMGGSATIDGGCGILSALGVRFLDSEGQALNPFPSSLEKIVSVDISGIDKRIFETEVVVLCDVDNVLLGPQGAATIYGPQKGSTADDIIVLEAFLTKFAGIAKKLTGKNIVSLKYGGTAGGAAAGLYAFLNAKLVNGIDYFLKVTDFVSSLEKADLVITGEGSLDDQTCRGKGPYGVASLAKLKGIPVIGLAGKVPLERNFNLEKYFNVIMPIGHQPQDLDKALAFTERDLKRTAKAIGDLLELKQKAYKE